MFPAQKTIIVYENELPSIHNKINLYHKNNFAIEKTLKFDNHNLDDVFSNYDCIMIANLSAKNKNTVLKHAYNLSIPIYEVPSIYDILINNANKLHIIDTPLLIVNNFGPSQLSKIVKRTFDIFFSLIIIMITSPIMFITSLAIKLNDGGPIIYRQERLTIYEKTFYLYKFRSMKIDAEKDGKAQLAKKNDDRITKIGKFIRATRIDELPQLFNILKGEMAVVGPRPERPEIANKIYKELPEFKYRLKMKAGLTGYAQIYGKYNTILKDKLLLDLMYIENYSLFLDIKLVMMTVKIIFIKDSTEGVS